MNGTGKRWAAGLLALAAAFLEACSRSPYGGMYGGGGGHMLNYGFGGIFMWLLVIVLIAAAVYFVVRQRGDVFPPPAGPRENETPLDILKKRYARGEIDREEFEQRKKDLEG